MIDLFDLYQDFTSRVNTSQGGFFRPQTDYQNALNVVQMRLWNKLIDQSEKSQRGIDELRLFLRSKNIIVKQQNSFYGIADIPEDYGRYASAKILISGNNCQPCQDIDNGSCMNGIFETDEEKTEKYYETLEEVRIEKIDNQRFSSVLTHLTKCPTLSKPKLTQINGGLRIAPRLISVVVLNYYVKPNDVKFAYTIAPGNIQTGSGDQIIYDKANSIQLGWPKTTINDFVEMLKEWYIEFSRDSQLAQISNSQKQQ